jgi:acyl carrier protein
LEPDFLDHPDGSSLDRVELVIAIEESLGSYIPPEDESKTRSFRTGRQAIDHIEKPPKDGGLN